jgi:excisionase family DNA binding protein
MEATFTVYEVAKLLKVHPVTVRNLMYQGVIEYVKVGRSVRVTQAELDRLLKARNAKKAMKAMEAKTK